MHIRFPSIDQFSFWIGFIIASFFWWIVGALRPALRHIRTGSKARREVARARSASGVEEHYRQALLQRAQGMHLASSLFSLEEIIEPPLLLAPPPRVEPGMPLYLEDIVSATIPYLPSWPELAAIYKAPTLTLAQALSGNSDIVLTGQTGTGKTVTLAYLVSRLVRHDPEPGLPENTLPFLIHVADLNLPLKKVDEPLAPLISYISEQVSAYDQPRIPEFVKQVYTEGRALLLIDGTDELTPDGLKLVIDFIKAVKKIYPNTRMVTTAMPEYLDGLVTLNFIPFTLAAWDAERRARFLEKWGDLWTRYVAVEAWAQNGPSQVDPLLLNGWLTADTTVLTPLELTLKAWGAYAGDIRGPSPVDAIETHLRRLTPVDSPREALETLALQISMAAEPIFDPHKAREWIKSFEPLEMEPDAQAAEVVEGETPPEKKGEARKPEKGKSPSLGLISKMADSGLLIQYPNNRMRFIHPVFSGYLAGRALVNYKPDSILEQPPWVGKVLALHYLAAHGDATPLIDNLFAQLDRPLSRNLVTPARWLRDAPHQAPWRGRVMAKLAELLQHEGQPMGLRGQALAAFIVSGDGSVGMLFRQTLQEHSAELLQLAALGCGAFQDAKAVDDLVGLFNNPSPNVRRAAALALVAIGTPPAMDTVADMLLHGDDELRRIAAEALANNPGEGHTMLKEGAVLKEDLMVRRAVAYGLGRIPADWTRELLAQLQVDDQWIVRNAATDVLESRQRPSPHIPRRLPPPSESPWLIEYAGKQGLGVSPDKLPVDLLLMALKTGSEDERLASLSYLRTMPMEGVFGALYQAMYGGDPDMREAVFQTFWEMAARGVSVPDPQQFGVG